MYLIPGKPAGTWVHRGDQLKPRRKAYRVIGSGNADNASLQRFTQCFENAACKLRQLIQKQNAVIGERNFTRTRGAAAVPEGAGKGLAACPCSWGL